MYDDWRRRDLKRDYIVKGNIKYILIQDAGRAYPLTFKRNLMLGLMHL
jgi:hypothetical protein